MCVFMHPSALVCGVDVCIWCVDFLGAIGFSPIKICCVGFIRTIKKTLLALVAPFFAPLSSLPFLAGH